MAKLRNRAQKKRALGLLISVNAKACTICEF